MASAFHVITMLLRSYTLIQCLKKDNMQKNWLCWLRSIGWLDFYHWAYQLVLLQTPWHAKKLHPPQKLEWFLTVHIIYRIFTRTDFYMAEHLLAINKGSQKETIFGFRISTRNCIVPFVFRDSSYTSSFHPFLWSFRFLRIPRHS